MFNRLYEMINEDDSIDMKKPMSRAKRNAASSEFYEMPEIKQKADEVLKSIVAAIPGASFKRSSVEIPDDRLAYKTETVAYLTSSARNSGNLDAFSGIVVGTHFTIVKEHPEWLATIKSNLLKFGWKRSHTHTEFMSNGVYAVWKLPEDPYFSANESKVNEDEKQPAGVVPQAPAVAAEVPKAESPAAETNPVPADKQAPTPEVKETFLFNAGEAMFYLKEEGEELVVVKKTASNEGGEEVARDSKANAQALILKVAQENQAKDIGYDAIKNYVLKVKDEEKPAETSGAKAAPQATPAATPAPVTPAEPKKESKEVVSEGLKSKKLADLAAKSNVTDLLKRMYKVEDLQLDQVNDKDIKYLDIAKVIAATPNATEDWSKRNAVRVEMDKAGIGWADTMFWVLKNPKKTPSGSTLKPGLLGVTNQDKLIHSESGYPQPARGMKHIDRMYGFADEVYAINTRNLRRGHGYGKDEVPGIEAGGIRNKREKEKQGAMALVKPEEIAKDNQRRYQLILTQRSPSPEVKAMADELNKYVVDKISQVDTSKMPGAKTTVPGIVGRRDKDISMSVFMRRIQDAWENLDYAQRYWSEYKQTSPEDLAHYKGYRKPYTLDNHDSYLKRAKKIVDELKSGKLDVWE